MTEQATIRALLELIAALDRRRPQHTRLTEASTANAVVSLRALAVRRILDLECDALTRSA